MGVRRYGFISSNRYEYFGGKVKEKIDQLGKDLFQRRRQILTVLVVILLIPMFQNCSATGFNSSSFQASLATSSGASAANGSDSTTGTTDTGSTDTGTPTVPTPPVDTGTPTTEPNQLAKKQAACKALTSKPSISTFPTDTAMTVSNIGTGGVANVDSAKFSLTAERGISDINTFTTEGCETQFELSLDCAVMTTDPTNYPFNITSALDLNGRDLVATAKQDALAKAAITANSCSMTFQKGTQEASFTIRPNTANNRCVQGTFWVKFTVKSIVNGTTGSYVSDPKYMKVQMNNACWGESKLGDSAGDLPAVVNFGTATAMTETWAAVLAPTDDASSSVLDVGSAYVYMNDGTKWSQKQKIMINGAASGESLQAVAIRGDTMILGSPYRNGKGAVYFLQQQGGTWTQVQQVDPQDIQANQFFGQSVAITDQYIYVGAPSAAVAGLSKAGAVSVYSYTSSGMTFVKTISGQVANAAFGAALAADGNLLAVGAPQAIGKEQLGNGSVYVFDATNGAFTQVSKKVGSSLAEKFGASVALFGTRLAVGSPNFSTAAKMSIGRVTYFDTHTASVATKTWDGAETSANLGQGLALSSLGIFIGSPYSNTRTGLVDFYKYDSLAKPYYRALAYNSTVNSAFGWSVAAAGSDVLIGARIKNDPNDNSGAAYIYRYK